MPTLLAIDSSTETLCLAACVDGQRAVWHGTGGAQASAVLLAQARALLEGLGATFTQLDAVAFARGPGAFTGLRTACAAAQGLAFGAGCGVLPIDSLMIVAQAAAAHGGCGSAQPCLGVVMDARMGELYAARYLVATGGLRAIESPCLTTPQALAQSWQSMPPDCVAGSGVKLLLSAPAGDQAGPRTVSVDDSQRTAALLALAEAAWQAGGVLAPEEALPIYVRDRVAQTTAERQAAVLSETNRRASAG